MKKALLAVSTERRINIGDSIQALAASQFLGEIDTYIEREKLSLYDGPECCMIMNGWYMIHPENWPPQAAIKPLFVAFHINATAQEAMLREESIAYLKQHEPIGCRDENTMNILKEKGVDAYFSGCLTLTLGENYYTEENDGKVYFVDPYSMPESSICNAFRCMVSLIANLRTVISVYNKDFHLYMNPIQRLVTAAAFVREYGKLFGNAVLRDSEYISQRKLKKDHVEKNNEELHGLAKDIVRKYAKAKLVITSRIHSALPCLGMETPVIYVNHVRSNAMHNCRFGGIMELFNVMDWDNKTLTLDPNGYTKDILSVPPKNKDNWKMYRDLLVEKCQEFANSFNK